MIRTFRVTKTDIKKAVQDVMSTRMYTLSATPQSVIDKLYDGLEVVATLDYTEEDLEQILSRDDLDLKLRAVWNERTAQFIVYVNQPFVKGKVTEDDTPILHKALVEAIKQSEFVVNDSYDIDDFL